MSAGVLSDAARQFLLDTAVESIRARLEHRRPVSPPGANGDGSGVAAEVNEPGASFVTLRDGTRLLGCVGSMTPVRSLSVDVAVNALNAAFADPRLPALTATEFEQMEVKISVLDPLEPLEVHSMTELQSTVRPGVDGLLITAGNHRGTFLPSVWEQVRSTSEFCDMLWRKAGLGPGAWPPNLRIERYRTTEFGDPGPRRPIAH